MKNEYKKSSKNNGQEKEKEKGNPDIPPIWGK
jgi:hypothetical protein